MRYFSTKLNTGFIALFSSQAIRKTSLSLLSVFMPVFWYGLFGGNIFLIILFYFLSDFLYTLILPKSVRSLHKFGFKRSIIVGSILGMVFYGILTFTNQSNALILVPISLFVFIVHKLLYWIPYHVDFAKFTPAEDRGRGVSAMFAAISFAGVIGPLLAGYILDKTNFNILFVVVVVLFALSIVPLLRLPKANETYTWGYRETWGKLFTKEYRRFFIAIAALGAENVVALIIWPIFVFLLLKGDVLEVGALSTIIFGAVVILQLALGRMIDVSKKRRYESLHFGSIFYAIGWVVKIFVVTAFQVFLVGFYHGVTKIFTRTPFDTLVYEVAADQGHYVDENTVLKEMSLHIGRMVGLVLVALLLVFFSLELTFLIAAGATLLLNVFYYREHQEALSKENVTLPQHQLHY